VTQFPVPEAPCVGCGAPHDYAYTVDGGGMRYEPDAVVICDRCAHVSVVADNLELRLPTPQEVHLMSLSDDLAAAIRAVHRRMGGRPQWT
jgi:hypothetical protein